jgi:hypothetical protein
MATLSSTDIVFYYTAGASGAANNTLALGGTISATNTVPDNTANNVFDDVTGDESTSGTIEYRAIAIKDTHASADMLNAKVWITGYVRAASNYDVMSFALAKPTGTTIELIANCYAAPTAAQFTVATGSTVAFTAEGSPSSTLTYGTNPAGSWFGLWLRRSVPAGAAAYSNRAVTIQVQCETTGSPLRTINMEFKVDFAKGDAIPLVHLYS